MTLVPTLRSPCTGTAWMRSALVCLALLGALSCGGTVSDPPPFIRAQLVPPYTPGVTAYGLAEASISTPLEVSATELGLPPGYTRAFFPGGSNLMQLNDLSTPFNIIIQGNGEPGEMLTVTPTPPDIPAYTVSNAGGVSPGLIYTASFNPAGTLSYNYIFDANGELHYFKRLNNTSTNFQKLTYQDGQQRYAYICDAIIYLMDLNFNIIRSYSYLPTSTHGKLGIDLHDFIFFDDDHYVVGSALPTTVDTTAYGGKSGSVVDATLIQEVQNGQVLWEWNSADYPQFYATHTDGGSYLDSSMASPADYMHWNSITQDPADNSYILSFRNQDAIIKILPYAASSNNGVIPIKWILGGGNQTIASNFTFYHQHMPRIVSRDGNVVTLSIFNDNNGHYATAPSNVIVADIDESSLAATLDDQFLGPGDAVALGSVQVFAPRHYFIDWGTVPIINEVVDGQTIFTMNFPGQFIYRAFKIQ